MSSGQNIAARIERAIDRLDGHLPRSNSLCGAAIAELYQASFEAEALQRRHDKLTGTVGRLIGEAMHPRFSVKSRVVLKHDRQVARLREEIRSLRQRCVISDTLRTLVADQMRMYAANPNALTDEATRSYLMGWSAAIQQAGVAQLEEQPVRNGQADGSIPSPGSKNTTTPSESAPAEVGGGAAGAVGAPDFDRMRLIANLDEDGRGS